MLIIDEISFAGELDLVKIFHYTKTLMQDEYQPFGGLNLVFAGDYSQLEPVGRPPIYNLQHTIPEFHDSLNSFIELDGMHRFKDDPEWGQRCLRFREGRPTEEDIETINDACMVGPTHVPPENIQVATYLNRDRDAINSAIFEEFCGKNKPADDSVLMDAVLIFMDDLQMANQAGTLVPVKSNSVF
ncbi:DNA helicase [Seminavis robusta]|uniref:DNA helicase n=1 Tax=Seminavis robusta TaxID=568900 RepID=A0A9N8E7R0_9STRA|nr:DNA helicase [Seminavis robusta]|eukprot:Sro712_g191380.1 DNA helicase (186) ;mRNA; f:32870-33427